MITVPTGGGAALCVESLGTGDVPLLLIAGSGWSMDWWDDELCARLVDRGRRVVRYDQRDTGASTQYPPGAPGYGAADLVDDALAILDHLSVARAHVVGLSMGGGIAQWLALDHPERVAALTVLSSSPVDPTISGLPGPAPELLTILSDPPPAPDWADRAEVISAVVEAERPCAGPGMFDEARVRAIATRVVDRTPDMAATMTNHDLLTHGGPADPTLARLAGTPTLVVHGTADPMLPVEHGRALANAIPGARLLELDGVGHQLPPPSTWDAFVDAVTT